MLANCNQTKTTTPKLRSTEDFQIPNITGNTYYIYIYVGNSQKMLLISCCLFLRCFGQAYFLSHCANCAKRCSSRRRSRPWKRRTSKAPSTGWVQWENGHIVSTDGPLFPLVRFFVDNFPIFTNFVCDSCWCV